MTWENIRQGNKHCTSYQSGSVLVPSSFRHQLTPAVQMFCRSGADGGAEALKRKLTAFFQLARSTSPCCSPGAQEMLEEMPVMNETCLCVAGRRFVKEQGRTVTVLTQTDPIPEQTLCLPGRQIISAGKPDP